MSSEICEIWAFPEEDYEVLLEIAPNGRIVQFIRQSKALNKLIAMKLWHSPEGSNLFKIRSMLQAEGYVRSMQREGDSLIIQNQSRTVCRRVFETEVPKWFSRELLKAHTIMTQIEQTPDQKLSNQAFVPYD